MFLGCNCCVLQKQIKHFLNTHAESVFCSGMQSAAKLTSWIGCFGRLLWVIGLSSFLYVDIKQESSCRPIDQKS